MAENEKSEGSPNIESGYGRELITNIGINALTVYRNMLLAERNEKTEENTAKDWGQETLERLNQQIKELDILEQLLRDFNSDPTKGSPLVLVDWYKRGLQTTTGPAETYSLSFAPKGEIIPYTPDRWQHQLRLHVNIANATESTYEKLHAIALSGNPPHQVLREFYQQSREQLVSINSVAVQRSDLDTRRFRINPHAGVSFQKIRGESGPRVGGVYYVGNTQHRLDIGRTVKPEVFAKIQSLIVEMVSHRG